MYVHSGVSEWRDRWRAKAWFLHPFRAEYRDHADLWRRVDAALRSRPPEHVVTCWGRGHARREQMLAGETCDMFCSGNVHADVLSRRGSQLQDGAVLSVPRSTPTPRCSEWARCRGAPPRPTPRPRAGAPRSGRARAVRCLARSGRIC
eukprot:gene19808-biopygen15343